MPKVFARKKYTASDANTWEKTFGMLMTPFETFAKSSTSSGILLIVCTIIALVLANSSLNHAYHEILDLKLSVNLNGRAIDLSLHHWINDGLMAIFFFLVGLEIKRELMVGALSSVKQALLPIIAAMGGMAVPALVFVYFNFAKEGIHGWGIPMATDIAFAIAALMMLGKRVPASAMTILAALAIVDDLGAVVVIAIFYTENLDLNFLLMALGCFVLLIAMNKMGIRKVWPFASIAVVMWFLMFFSGVHATIAGVLGAFATPVNSLYKPEEFSREARKLLDKFDIFRSREKDFFKSERLTGALDTLNMGINKARTPLQRLEHGLHNPVYFFIIPVFALANAGIPIDINGLGEILQHPVTIGVGLGLILGKLVGVAGSILLFKWLGVIQLPSDLNNKHVIGMGLLAGIGFTMSIFIAELAFVGHSELLIQAKTAIIFASIIAGLLGYFFLFFTSKNKQVVY